MWIAMLTFISGEIIVTLENSELGRKEKNWTNQTEPHEVQHSCIFLDVLRCTAMTSSSLLVSF